MRPNTLGSLRWIAAVLLLSGCYRPFMNPQQGYGYGGAYSGGMSPGGYGGAQGIQTLTPGQYYAPGAGGATYLQGTPNNLQPVVDPNNSGTSGGTGSGNGNGAGGGDAPIYNPPENGTPARLPPMYDDTPSLDDPGRGLQAPASDPTIQENNSGNGDPSALLEPAPIGDWATESTAEADPTIEPVHNEEVETATDIPPLLSP